MKDKHEIDGEEHRIKPSYATQTSSVFGQNQRVYDLVYNFQEMLQQLLVFLAIFYFFPVVPKHVRHPKLGRKGGYIFKRMNGFV